MAKEPEWDVILNGTLSSPLVIIDAYNVIHKWPRLKKWMNKGMLHRAREMLLLDLEELKSLKGWRIEVVFDGAGRSLTGPLGDGPGGSSRSAKVTPAQMQATAKVTDHGIRVVYSGSGMSADSYIEARCLEAKQVTGGKLHSSTFVVATDDNMIRIAATNAGAVLMGSQRIVDELKTVKKMAMYRVEVALASVNGNNNGMVRHEKLKNNPALMNPLFRRGQVIIEDKRERKKLKKINSDIIKSNGESSGKAAELKDVIQGTKSTPSWAVLPNCTETST